MRSAPVHISSVVASHTCARIAVLSFLLSLLSIYGSAQDTVLRSAPGMKIDSAFTPGDKKAAAMESTGYYSDSLSPQQKKRRIRIVAATNIAGYSAVMAGLYASWYKKYPQTNFHSFNDMAEWKQLDKIGHAYSAYAAGKASMEMWRWSGIDRKKRIWIGGMSGAAWQTIIETLDAFSTEWGWSWGDIGANIAGSALLVSQELAWDEQRVQFKFSFHRKRYADPVLQQRSNAIFGTSGFERLFKDYNGQTYWLSTSLHSFFPKSKLPPWLQVSIGTGVEGLFGARENIGKDADGNVNFSRTDVRRYRQWYLAPDIDLARIPTRNKVIRLALQLLNVFKFPMPALEYSNGRFRFNAISY